MLQELKHYASKIISLFRRHQQPLPAPPPEPAVRQCQSCHAPIENESIWAFCAACRKDLFTDPGRCRRCGAAIDGEGYCAACRRSMPMRGHSVDVSISTDGVSWLPVSGVIPGDISLVPETDYARVKELLRQLDWREEEG